MTLSGVTALLTVRPTPPEPAIPSAAKTLPDGSPGRRAGRACVTARGDPRTRRSRSLRARRHWPFARALLAGFSSPLGASFYGCGFVLAMLPTALLVLTLTDRVLDKLTYTRFMPR